MGRGRTEHGGPRDAGRKHGFWGETHDAKAWASRARRRDEREELRAESQDDRTAATRDVADDQT